MASVSLRRVCGEFGRSITITGQLARHKHLACPTSAPTLAPTSAWGTFGKPAGNFRETFGRFRGTFGKPSGNLRQTFGEPCGNRRKTFGKPSGNLLGTFGEPSGNLLGNLLGSFGEPLGNLRYTCNTNMVRIWYQCCRHVLPI